MRNFILSIIALMAAMVVTSCIEDGYVTKADAQPQFSVDTLDMGAFFTEDVTPTFRFVVYNRHDKILQISHVGLRDGGKGIFRLNVDGMSGHEFTGVDIRPNDSIFVFVEATLPPNGRPDVSEFIDKLDFLVNGRTSTVVLRAEGMDVERRRGIRIEQDTRWSSTYPYQIFDSLVVAEGATLTLDPGVKLYFHDKATLKVRGTLRCEGTSEAPVEMSGDRTDNVVGQIPFDLMAGQWTGVAFDTSSRDNYMSHTVIRNTRVGVVLDSIPSTAEAPALTMVNCRLRNSQRYALESYHSAVKAVGCELADAAYGVVLLVGGDIVMNHCTIANYYLFTAIGGEALQLYHVNGDSADESGLPYMRADISNCVIYGLGTDLNMGDLTGTEVFLRRCLLKSEGTDDANFIDCLWGEDPLYYTVREDYIFDYRPQPESPAIGAAFPALMLPEAATDFYGIARGATPSVGAYEPTP